MTRSKQRRRERRESARQQINGHSLSPAPPGLVRCDACESLVVPRGDHYSVHFAKPSDLTPCPRSWSTPKRKP